MSRWTAATLTTVAAILLAASTASADEKKPASPSKQALPELPGLDPADRVYRWHIVLDTRTGDDYLKQLRMLKAFIGKPEKVDSKISYRIIRDLTQKPAQGKIEDPAKVDCCFFAFDTKPESVQALCGALGWKDKPDHVVIFLPRTLEKDLVRKELAYRGRKIEQIAETQFRFIQRGQKYEVVVTDQRVMTAPKAPE